MAAPPTKEYAANCHCRAVQLSLRIPSLEDGHAVTKCNCSICTRNGYLLVFPDLEDGIEWIKGKDGLKQYQFGGKNANHWFCPTCGSSMMVQMIEGGKTAINVRMIKGVDVDKVKTKEFDGWGMLPPAYES